VLREERGGGQALKGGIREQMEHAMGLDLDGVRVHTDAKAAQLSDELSARAFTHGRDIYFASGEYAPDSEGGQKVLAHELAHVAQQYSGPKLIVGSAQDPAEREADRIADRIVSSVGGRETGASLNRQVEEEEEELMPLRRQVEEEEEEEELMPLRRQVEEKEEEQQQ
jgi:hypothetical protein